MTGTWINVSTILLGSLLGISVGARFPESLRTTVVSGLGLVCTLIGMKMALETENILVLLGAILAGGMVGEILHIDQRLDRLGALFQSFFTKGKASRFSEGFVTASLVFCVGPMAILGSIQDGLSGDYSLLTLKSMLDGFAAIAFSASLGWGVSFSALSIFLYQGTITLFAGFFDRILTEQMIVEMSAAGGLIIVGIGLKLLNIKDLPLANFLPALAFAPFIIKIIPIVKNLLHFTFL